MVSKIEWPVGTKIEYNTTAGLVWKGEVVEQDGVWRRLRWSDGPLPMWLSVLQLQNKAKKLTEQKARPPKPAIVERLTGEKPKPRVRKLKTVEADELDGMPNIPTRTSSR